ncbi:methionyl-tRNA formyltransferase [Bacillus piscicola]|uniref:methionyl-tRNA formyltransferase n=1 Tax=Bacillus piscicola TaxID=1632684 RepID=UPI001F08DE31|nr:methionyl-tRNA formyltransferase [Bacillus piscicola]
MNIVFMGTPDFAVPILNGLVAEGYTIGAVITQPDRPKGRKKTLTPPPVKEAALAHGLKVLQPETLKEAGNVDEILEEKPDMIITAAFGQILPEAVLEAPRYGAINVHASLLPLYRGGAPIHQAIIDGQEKTGITIMYMVKQLDAGDMLAQQEIEIAETDNVGTLHDKLSIIGRDLLLETIPALINERAEAVPQRDEEATFAPNIQRGQEEIQWEKHSSDIYNQIRGMNPWPVAYTTYKGKNFKVWQARKRDVSLAPEAEPGTILELTDEITVAAGGGTAISLSEIQPAGKKRMSAADYLRGKHEFQLGERFGQ